MQALSVFWPRAVDRLVGVEGWLRISEKYLASVDDQDLLAGVPLLADEEPRFDCNVPRRLKGAALQAAQARRGREAEERYERMLEREAAEAKARLQPEMPLDPGLRAMVERILEKARERSE